MSYKDSDFDFLKNIIIPAIDLFYNIPPNMELIRRKVSERNIVTNIYCKMNFFFREHQASNPDLHYLSIDAEYDRNYLHEKFAYQKCHTCRFGCFVTEKSFPETENNKDKKMAPDIIIHQRNSNENNQVAIEFKKVSNRKVKQRENDTAKLTFLTCQQTYHGHEESDYNYKYGYFIDLDKDSYIITTFQEARSENPRKRKNGNWL